MSFVNHIFSIDCKILCIQVTLSVEINRSFNNINTCTNTKIQDTSEIYLYRSLKKFI